jgi:uncharacterized membrane protein HdeD (DUF308 family)
MPVYWVMGNPGTGTWKAPLGFGICAILIGALFLFLPGFSLQVIIYLFGALAIVLAILLFIGAYFVSRTGTGLFALPLILGICAFILGLVAFVNPTIIGAFLVVILSIAFIIGGLGMIFTSAFRGGPVAGTVLGVIGGFFITAIGIMVLFYPQISLEVIIRLLGLFLIAMGIVAIGWSLVSRGRERSTELPYQDVDPYEKAW